jgi:hypothetical protein
MPDTTGVVTDHDTRLVPKVQATTPVSNPPIEDPAPFKGMLWWDTASPSFVNYLKVTILTSGPYTLLSGDELLVCSNTFNILLSVATRSGRVFTVKNQGIGIITLIADTAFPDKIDGEAYQEVGPGDCLVVCDGDNNKWIVI